MGKLFEVEIITACNDSKIDKYNSKSKTKKKKSRSCFHHHIDFISSVNWVGVRYQWYHWRIVVIYCVP